MEEKIKNIVGDSIRELDLVVDSVIYEKENGNNFLRICLDSKNIIDLDLIVKASKIINPLIDEADLISEQYNLEIYGKSKGSIE